MRQCTTCKEWKDIDEFYRYRQGVEKRRSQCRACRAAYAKKYRDRPGVREKENTASRSRYIASCRNLGDRVDHSALEGTRWYEEQQDRVSELAARHQWNVMNGTEEPLCGN